MRAENSFYKAKYESEVAKKKDGIHYSFTLSTNEKKSQKWNFSRSLNEFHEFRIKLARVFPDIPSNLPLIKLIGSLSKEEKEVNTAQVFDFVQKLIKRTDVMTFQQAAEFFQIPEKLRENLPQSEILMSLKKVPKEAVPQQQFEVKREIMSWPASHFVYSPDKNILIVAGSVLDEAAQLAKEANNYNWPCCKKNENQTFKPISEVRVAQIEFDQQNFKFGNLESWHEFVIFTAEFNKPITALHWSDSSSQLGIGFSNGLCAVIEINFESQNQEMKMQQENWYKISSAKVYNMVNFWQRHTNKITSIKEITDQNSWITTSLDKTFQITEIQGGVTDKFTQQMDSEAITSLFYDQGKTNLCYVGSKSGIVSVLDVNETPQKVFSFAASIDSAVSAIHVDSLSKYIFVATKDKAISVFEPLHIAEMSSPYRIFHVKGKAKITNLDFNSENGEIYAADTVGNITVWGLLDVPKYAWNAHSKSILCMQYIPQFNAILTCSKDKEMKIWKITDDWIPEDWAQFLSLQDQNNNEEDEDFFKV